jgi:hypothetical protein
MLKMREYFVTNLQEGEPMSELKKIINNLKILDGSGQNKTISEAVRRRTR